MNPDGGGQSVFAHGPGQDPTLHENSKQRTWKQVYYILVLIAKLKKTNF